MLRLRGQGHEAFIGVCKLYGLGRESYLELEFPMYMWQSKAIPRVHDEFLRVVDVHGVKIDGAIELYEEDQNCGLRWTPTELMRIGSYVIDLDPTKCDDDTRKFCWRYALKHWRYRRMLTWFILSGPEEWDEFKNQNYPLRQFVQVKFPDIVLRAKRMGSEEAPKEVVLSFQEPADQSDMFGVLKRNIAANWGIAPQKIVFVASGTNADVVIEDDGDVFQLHAGDLIHFGVDA